MGDRRPWPQRWAELFRTVVVDLDAIKRGITPHHFRLPSVQTTKDD
jgi:hypothetical protein